MPAGVQGLVCATGMVWVSTEDAQFSKIVFTLLPRIPCPVFLPAHRISMPDDGDSAAPDTNGGAAVAASAR